MDSRILDKGRYSQRRTADIGGNCIAAARHHVDADAAAPRLLTYAEVLPGGHLVALSNPEGLVNLLLRLARSDLAEHPPTKPGVDANT